MKPIFRSTSYCLRQIRLFAKYILLCILLLFPYLSHAQLVTYSFTGAAGNEVTFPPDNQPTSGTASNMSRGSGLTASASANTFSASAFSTMGIDLNDYFTFSIQPNTSFQLIINRIEFDERRSLTGIRTLAVRSSKDAYATDLAVFNVPDDDLTRTQTINLVCFTRITANTTFRIYGYASEAAGGTWRIDNVKVFGSIIPLTPPHPIITNLEVIDNQNLELTFSEEVEQISAQTPTNYYLNGNTAKNPNLAERNVSNFKKVKLTFATPFPDNIMQTLSVINVKDLCNFAIPLATPQTQNFTFVPDTSPPAITGVTVLNLNQIRVKFSENVNLTTAQNAANYFLNGGIGSPTSAVRNPLDNSEVTLTFANSMTILQNYILTVTNVQDNAGNAIISETFNFVHPDIYPPLLVQLKVISQNSIDLIFNENLDQPSAQTLANYNIAGNPLLTALLDNIQKNIVHLFFSTNFPENSNRTLNINNIKDLAGNTISPIAQVFQYDTRRPTLDLVEFLGTNQLILTFSEPLDPISALVFNNYQFTTPSNSVLLPTATAFVSSSQVRLTFPYTFQQGETYNLRVAQIKDLAGNIMTTRNVSLSFDVQAPNLLNLIVWKNLKMIELRFSEPLEKISAETASNFSISNLTDMTAPSQPTSALICVDNPTILYLNFATALTNDKDFSLTISNLKDLLDNTIMPISSNFNTIKPRLAKIKVLDKDKIDLYFSESVLPALAEEENNYLINNIPPSLANLDATDLSLVHLTLSQNMVLGNSNTLQIKNIEDINSNIIDLSNTSFTYQNFVSQVVVRSANLLDVIFSQIVPDVLSANTNLYFLNNDPMRKAAGAVLDQSDKHIVKLIFAENFAPNTTYQLTLGGFALNCGNYLPVQTHTFSLDTSIPRVISVLFNSPTEIEVTFSKPIEKNSAEAINHYTISNSIGLPASVSLKSSDTKTVVLRLANPLQINVNYTLTVQSIRDLLGNVLISQNFFFARPAVPKYGELIISEIFADPTPKVGLPEVEYLELYNNSQIPFELNGIKLEDSGVQRPISKEQILPNEFVILCAASQKAIFEPFGKVVTVSSMSLTNSGEELKLIDPDNNLIYKVNYSDTWYKDNQKKEGGWSLEIINPNSTCDESSNWIASQDEKGGTPAKENSVWKENPDKTTLEISKLEIIDLKTLKLTFSQNLDSLTLVNKNNYQVSNINLSNLIFQAKNAVNLQFFNNLDSATLYQLEIKNVKDCAGNVLNTVVGFGIGKRAKLHDLVISEIMANEILPTPTTEPRVPQAEYLEIYNRTNSLIMLGNLILKDATAEIKMPNTFIKPKSYLVLTSTTKASLFNDKNVIGVTSFITLNNTGEELIIKDSSANNVIHSINYTDAWYKDEEKKKGGWSLEMIDTENFCVESANWRASTAPQGGTPAKSNSVLGKVQDNTPPQVTSFAIQNDNQIVLTFSELIEESSLRNLQNYVINNGLSVSTITIESRQKVILNLHQKINANMIYELKINGLKDCGDNNLTYSTSFGLGRLPLKNEILITEIFADETPQVGLPLVEYLEIFNNSNSALTLNGLQLSDATSTARLPNVILQPQEYAVLCSNTRIDSFLRIIPKPKVIGVSSFPSLNNTGELLTISRIDNREVIHFVNYSDTWYKDAVKKQGGWSLEMIDIHNICGEEENWTASIDPLGGTPSRQNSVFASNPDITPPQVSNLSLIQNPDEQLQVIFSEKMDTLTLKQLENYQVSNSLSIKKLELVDEKTVRFTIDKKIEDNLLYTLSVKNVKDCSGNLIEESNLTFGKGKAPNFHELLITEIMADPTPVVKLPEREYVEIYNNTEAVLNLADVYFHDESARIRLSGILRPREYVVLCANSVLKEFAILFPDRRFIGLSSLPSLTNAGEKLELRNGNGNILFSVTYNDTWYRDEVKKQGGWALEMIDTNNPCGEAENWTASENPLGGTPALQNSVKGSNPDLTPPMVSELIVQNSTILTLRLSEKIDSLYLTKIENFDFAPTLKIKQIDVQSEKEINLILETPLQVEVQYSLQIKELKDCSGNTLTNLSLSFGLGSVPAFQEIIITEFMPDPSPVVNLPESEYLEIYNSTTKVLSLGGMALTNQTTSTKLPFQVLFPKEYAVLVPNSAVAEFKRRFPSAKVIGLSPWVSLPNNSGRLTLRNSRGQMVFDLAYSSDWYKDIEKKDGGWSLEMRDLASPCLESVNWEASKDLNGGTPAKANSVSTTVSDNTPPALLRVEAVNNSQIRLIFNEKLDSLSAVNAQYQADNNLKISKIQFDYLLPYQVNLTFEQNFERNKLYTIAVRSIRDCSGNALINSTQAQFVLPEQGQKGDVLINEILFNPPTYGVDFVEIYNISDKYLNLQNWRLGNASTNHVISREIYIFPPKTYLALTKDKKQLKSQYPQGVDSLFLEMSSFPTYNDDSGTAILYNDLVEELDRFDYHKDFHFRLLDDKNGVSLERISFSAPTNDRQNWHSAGSPTFGTPAYKNSQARPDNAPRSLANECFTLENKVFTPDGDGFQDLLFIYYTCNATNVTANIFIFDAQGRRIKTLAQNQLISASGFVQWDGTDDSYQKARVGQYAIFIELFDLQGNVQRIQLNAVVGAKF
ncbi:lamin tail domain-containing protein [Thermoflexibacter ruber]|uniref:Ig-like domain-containing protein n=1 Tax=Thermoflexibacter ruber TaxID=1003 RepID=A0A1I2CFW4_9BACT|nr:lamin tail domain-containing protein [Thermoflexibacter ruber]SFE67221.1 Ig-like domain-containing protein [Thermoflexibacter ruber]